MSDKDQEVWDGELTPELIAELQTMDTPTVCNALELIVPKRRGSGLPPSIWFVLAQNCRPWWALRAQLL